MATIIVSACLLGCRCRYKGDSCKNDSVIALAESNVLIPVCPEQLGGLPTPRNPSEIINGNIIMRSGKDVTEEYQKGAEEALYLAKQFRADFAVLKSKSPSCGHGMIYDGTFSGNLVPGNGVTASLLETNGIPVYSEQDLENGLLPIM